MGLASLQKQLLKDIFKRDCDIVDYQRGKKMIEETLCKENVLLVLDDVDNQEQVNALAGELNWFGLGSRVIITTRDECILDVAKVEKDKIYRPYVLNFKQSLQLFSLHAFSNDQPPEDYMQLSQEVAHYSGGLPLTLKVLGSYFSDISSKKIWKSTLQKLKKIPHEEVQRRLRISYDNLEDNYQKAIFLDIACFFIGWETETVILIWEACGYHPKSALYRLIKRSLLTLEDNFLRMHDQIRDMGRNIVLEEDFMEPSKRSRLWSKGEILEVLEGYKGTDMINGMMLPASLPRIGLCNRQFKMMHNLKYLNINHANYKGDFSCLPFGLIFFKWLGCRKGHILPNNFYHKRLVYLDLSKSKIAQAWNAGPQNQNKRFQKLKLLDLKHCEYLSTSPNFSWFPSLVQLDLEGCHSLDKLDESIGQLRKLRSLNLCSCRKMKELPMSIGDLKSLKKLDLSKITQMEELPDNISQLSSLKELNLQSCNALKKLPDSIGNLKSLVELDLSRTVKMEELPDSISHLSCLKKLTLRSCHSLKKLPKSIGYLTSLVELQLFEASGIEELLDGVGQLEKLEVLNATLCHKLLTLPVSMVRMCFLRDLQLEGTQISSFPFDISHLKNLKQLNLGRCRKLEYLSQLPSSLVVLDCDGCGSLVRLPDLSRLKILMTLKLSACEKLVEIPGLEGLESLEYLNLLRCFNLRYTSRSICGQGTLLFHKSQKTRFSLTTDDGIYNKGLILCIVLKFPSNFMDLGLPVTFDFIMVASIHQKDKRTRCFHSLRIKVVRFTASPHIIYIHHFEGFDWFGIPLQGKDAIEILAVAPHLDYYDGRCYPTVKLVEVLFENREPGPQMANDQHSVARMVADFFNWSYVDDDVGLLSLSQSVTCSLEEVEGSNSVPREEGEIDKTSSSLSTQEEERNDGKASDRLLEFLSRVYLKLQNDDEQYLHIEQ